MASKPNPKLVVAADKIAAYFSEQILDKNVLALEPKLFVGYNDQGEDSDEMNSSDGLIEMIEVDESWVDRCIEDDCNDETDRSFNVNEICVSEDQIDLIEVGEDWVSQNLEADFHVDQELTDISSDICVRDLDRTAELRASVKKIKGNSNFNKKRSVRKRRTFQMPLKQRLTIKKQILQHEHKVRRPCKHDDCNSIELKRRLEINKEFWEMPYRERYLFGLQSIHRSDVRHRRNGTSQRKANHNDFFLISEAGETQQVCKVFYLTTLGFSKQNDSFIRTAVGKEKYKKPLPRLINRVDNLKLEIPNYALIIAHIKSFEPNVSHYRRVHAPKRKYLPETLTIQAMFVDFQSQHGDIKCSYYLYRRIVTNELNISFAKLGHEQCETCEEYILHKKSLPMCTSCDLCDEHKLHKIKYTEARQLYDTQRLLNTEKKAFFSGDLEKVIMLPRLEMFKQAIFTTRLSAYNDTFAPLGGMENNPSTSKPIAILWHEGISGRCKEDIISAFLQFFLLKRDVDECVVWLDNCSSQNKNWALFTFLVFIINSDLISAHKIQFNYFEPGHTFMSADSFHKQVENSLDKMNKVYDFEDFKTAVSTANSGNVTVVPMDFSKFYKWQDHSSNTKKQNGHHYMHEMVQVTATRGSYDLLYKKSFSSDEEFTLNFLQEKYKKNGIPCPVEATSECGVSKERKANILKLSGILKDGKSQFYRNLTVSSEAAKREISGTEQPKLNAKLQLAVASETEVASTVQSALITERHLPLATEARVTLAEQPALIVERQLPPTSESEVASTVQSALITERHLLLATEVKVAAAEQPALIVERQLPPTSESEVASTVQSALITERHLPLATEARVTLAEQPALIVERQLPPTSESEVASTVQSALITERHLLLATEVKVAAAEQPALIVERQLPPTSESEVASTVQSALITERHLPLATEVRVTLAEQPELIVERQLPPTSESEVASTVQSALITERHLPLATEIKVATAEQPALIAEQQLRLAIETEVDFTEQPKSRAGRQIRVTSNSKAAAIEQQKSKSIRQIRAASKAEAAAAEQLKSRAGKQIRAASKAKSTATEQPKSNARQAKGDTKKMVKKTEPKPQQPKFR